jgi:hypothetical protein
MSKKNKNDSISDSLNLIVKKVKTLQENGDVKTEKSLNEILLATEEVQKFFKGIQKIFIIIISFTCLLLVLLIISWSYNDKLESINSELENQRTDSIIRTIMNIKRIKTDSSSIRSYHYSVKGNKIVTYKELLVENDSLENIIDSLEILKINIKSKNNNYEKKLKLIKDNYGVEFSEFYKVINKDTTNYIRMKGKKIDSAFMLLEAYRKNLIYNKEKNEWYIQENK